MVNIGLHELPMRLRSLQDRLLAVADETATPEAIAVVARLVVPDRTKPHLVFTGQFSSGKSTLIKALTDGQATVQIAVDVATDTVTEFDWDGVVQLVDTPGVKAGFDSHDAMAEEAIAAADLVLFCVTVQLFDEAAAGHLLHVADGLGKRDQLMVVITKAGTMAAEEGIRREAVAAILGSELPPILQCDADDYLYGLEAADAEQGQEFQRLSGVPQLKSAINAFSEERGELAALRLPFQVVKALAMELQGLITDDPTEQAALKVLARQKEALARRRQRIYSQLDESRERFLNSSAQAAEAFAAMVESVDEEPEATRQQSIEDAYGRLLDKLQAGVDRLAQDVQDVLLTQFEDLAVEAAEIESGPYAQLIELRRPESTPTTRMRDADPIFVPPVRDSASGMPPWLDDMQEQIKGFNAFWAAGGGLRDSSGTMGHKIILDGGHFFGHKFKPWQAVRWADGVGKVARGAAVALPILIAGTQIFVEERARIQIERKRQARHRSITSEVTFKADRFASEHLKEIRDAVDSQFDESSGRIDELYRNIRAASAQRSRHQTELELIVRECDLVILGTDQRQIEGSP